MKKYIVEYYSESRANWFTEYSTDLLENALISANDCKAAGYEAHVIDQTTDSIIYHVKN